MKNEKRLVGKDRIFFLDRNYNGKASRNMVRIFLPDWIAAVFFILSSLRPLHLWSSTTYDRIQKF
jgi:hypothetical protein